MKPVKRYVILIGLLVLAACEIGPTPAAVARQYVEARLNGDRDTVLSLVTDEDEELLRTEERFAKFFTEGIAEVELTELQQLLNKHISLKVQGVKREGDSAEVTATVDAPDLINMLDGLWGTSYVDYITGEPEERKAVDVRLLEAYADEPVLLLHEEITVPLVQEADGWRVKQGLREILEEERRAAEAAKAYLAHIKPRSQKIRPRTMQGLAIYDVPFMNAGDQTITDIEYNVYFLSEDGIRVGEYDGYTLVYKDIAPGYEFSVTGTFKVVTAPKSWGGDLEIEIVSLALVQDEKTAD